MHVKHQTTRCGGSVRDGIGEGGREVAKGGRKERGKRGGGGGGGETQVGSGWEGRWVRVGKSS